MKRRNIITKSSGRATDASFLSNPAGDVVAGKIKKKFVLVGTGSRGISFWVKRDVVNYNDLVKFAGLHDINPGRYTLGTQAGQVA